MGGINLGYGVWGEGEWGEIGAIVEMRNREPLNDQTTDEEPND
jgi:hypothetical protein